MRVFVGGSFTRRSGRTALRTWLATSLLAAGYAGSADAISPPTLSAAFAVATIPLNGTTNLEFTIINPNTSAMSGIGFADTLPAGLLFGSSESGGCGGSQMGGGGTDTISLTGISLEPFGMCSLVIEVVGTSAGPKQTTAGPVTSSNGGTGNSATASITVLAPPSLNILFNAGSIAVHDNTTLFFEFGNPNGVALTGTAFSDTLPAGLAVATPTSIVNGCNSGTITAAAGSSSISLSGMTVPVNPPCFFYVEVTGTAPALASNTTGPISSTNGGTGAASNTATIRVTNGPVNTHDFSADGRSDIVWRQSGGAAAMWIMFDRFIGKNLSLGTVPPNWSLVGQRDVDHDSFYDLIWRDTSAGTVVVWSDGGSAASTSLGTVPTNWVIAGACDLNADGVGDLIWRDNTTGAVAIWLLNDAPSVQQTGSLGVVPLNWTIAGTGDFDHDGNCDILWRDGDTGTVSIWLMNGLSVVQSGSIGVVPANWSIVGTGDFNGDGRADILWRDGNTGTVAMWLMNGLQISQAGSLGVVPSNWIVADTGDYDGDQRSDILWRDTGSGAVAMWFMVGLQVSSTAGVGTVTTDWTIQGTNVD